MGLCGARGDRSSQIAFIPIPILNAKLPLSYVHYPGLGSVGGCGRHRCTLLTWGLCGSSTSKLYCNTNIGTFALHASVLRGTHWGFPRKHNGIQVMTSMSSTCTKIVHLNATTCSLCAMGERVKTGKRAMCSEGSNLTFPQRTRYPAVLHGNIAVLFLCLQDG